MGGRGGKNWGAQTKPGEKDSIILLSQPTWPWSLLVGREGLLSPLHFKLMAVGAGAAGGLARVIMRSRSRSALRLMAVMAGRFTTTPSSWPCRAPLIRADKECAPPLMDAPPPPRAVGARAANTRRLAWLAWLACGSPEARTRPHLRPELCGGCSSGCTPHAVPPQVPHRPTAVGTGVVHDDRGRLGGFAGHHARVPLTEGRRGTARPGTANDGTSEKAADVLV